jgi:hypothetical protein
MKWSLPRRDFPITRDIAALSGVVAIGVTLTCEIKHASGFASNPTAVLPTMAASNKTVPEPQKGSSTSPLDRARISVLRKKCGMCGRSFPGYECR